MKSIHPNFLTLTLAGLLSAASASVLAQPMPEAAPKVSAPAPAAGAPSFQSLDSNGDGKISLTEFKAQGGRSYLHQIDTDQDKGLTQMSSPSWASRAPNATALGVGA
jgi:hypothetical protein